MSYIIWYTIGTLILEISMAKRLNIDRDTKKQLEYKAQLEEESRRLYGSVRCWACHKPYKGLIASHIKPYKLCVIEGDEHSQFNVNNGLLLSKNIDDYFDKLDITFDDDGNIICSDNVQEEIREEFKNYKLDSIVLNNERRQYLALHRSLFYYKNYIAAEPISYEKQFEKIDIPYFDCGIKFYKSQFIISIDNRWYCYPTAKVKEEFIRRTQFKFKCYISNADFVNLLLKNEKYLLLGSIKAYLNFKTYSIDLEQPNVKITDNVFKLCATACDPVDDLPTKFLEILTETFSGNLSLLRNFQRIFGLALSGQGYNDCAYMYGDVPSINFIMDVLQYVLGSYFLEYPNNKILYKNIKVDSIPNTRILYFREHDNVIQHRQISKIAENEVFPKSIVNIDRYVAFISSTQIPKEHNQQLIFKFNKINQMDAVKQIMTESGKILNWLLNGYKDYKILGFEQTNESYVDTSAEGATVEQWLKQCCLVDINNPTYKERASDLYESFQNFIADNALKEISARMFYLILGKKFHKKRYSAGYVYLGIKLQ